MSHRYRPLGRARTSWVVCAWGFAVAAGGCSSSDSAGADADAFDAEHAPYGAYTPTTLGAYQLSFLGTSARVESRNLGTKTIAGMTFDRDLVGDPALPDHGFELWVADHSEAGSIDFGGFDARSVVGAPFTATLASPVHVPLAPTVGQAQAVSGTATITSPTDLVGQPVQVTGSYTRTESDASVTTAAGVVHGCNHYTGAFVGTGDAIPAAFRGTEVTGELWWHPSYGVVAAKSSSVPLDTLLAESSDCGAAEVGSFAVTRKTAVIDATHPFTLDTYDCAQQFDADKQTHAGMLLELRWLDEASARTHNPVGYPFVHVEFGTVFGYFPTTAPLESAVSVFHPEENGLGMNHWLTYVNQAAKNESGSDGIAYHIRVTVDPGFSAIRATARIHYRKIAP